MMNHKRRVLERKLHKVVITGDSHARGCASEVRQQLYSDYEVLGFVNSGLGIKFI